MRAHLSCLWQWLFYIIPKIFCLLYLVVKSPPLWARVYEIHDGFFKKKKKSALGTTRQITRERKKKHVTALNSVKHIVDLFLNFFLNLIPSIDKCKYCWLHWLNASVEQPCKCFEQLCNSQETGYYQVAQPRCDEGWILYIDWLSRHSTAKNPRYFCVCHFFFYPYLLT